MTDLGDERFALYRLASTAADRATAHAQQVGEQYRPVLDDDNRRLQGEADAAPDPMRFVPQRSAEGARAEFELTTADDAVSAALGAVERAVADMVSQGLLQVGDRVRSPYRWDGDEVIVAELIDAEAHELCTVVMSDDGEHISFARHNPVLRLDGTAIDDGTTPVYFETWWGRGLRVAGTAHPISRGMLDVTVNN